MKIYIGADHRGVKLKKDIVEMLSDKGHDVIDVGTHQEGTSCDYPPISFSVARRVAAAKNSRGILVCMTGIGHSIAANKVRGAYAALCYNKQAAALSRQHNNANILVLGAKFVTKKQLKIIITTWLKTEFEGGRHLRRVNKIKQKEREAFKK